MAVVKYKASDGWHIVTGISETASGNSDPTTSTQGYVGQFYLNVTTGNVFICRVATQGSYAWVQVGYADLSNKENVSNKSNAYSVTYTWEKWNIENVTTYSERETPRSVSGEATSSLLNSGKIYVFSSKPQLNQDGEFYGESAFDTRYSSEIVMDTNYFYCTDPGYYSVGDIIATTAYIKPVNSSVLTLYTDGMVYNPVSTDGHLYKYTVKSTTSQQKGSTSYGDVTSYTSDAYPQNGIQDGYWYVYKGSSLNPEITYASTKALIDGLSTKDNKGKITIGSTLYTIDDPVTVDPGQGTAGHIIIVTG